MNLTKNAFHCFSCKAKGNVLDLVAAMEKCSVRDAAMKLHEWFSVDSAAVPAEKKPSIGENRGEGTELGNKPLGFELKGVDLAHPYLEGRGISRETAETFGVGLFSGRGSMSGRVVIPIHNELGELVAYAGRSIDGKEPRYKLPVGFHKSHVLFNLRRATGVEVIVVEGFFDCMKVWQSGRSSVVALMGSSLSERQECLLVDRFQKVTLVLDGDEAGRTAAEEIAARLIRQVHVRIVDPYNGSRDLRAVSARYLAADSAGATEWSYGISRDNASGASVHATMTLSDASGVGTKTWNFATSGTYEGLVTEFVQSASAGGTVLQDDLYTWSQSPSGKKYISAKSSTIGQGTSNVQTAYSTQTLDQYGNVTQSAIYPYNNTTTPLATYNYTYLSSSTYTSNYIFNRLVTATVTPAGGSAITLVTNSYDSGRDCTYFLDDMPPTQCNGTVTPTASPTYQVDAAPPIPVNQRGYLTSSVTPAKSTTLAVYTYGSPAMVWGSDGTVSSASADPSTDFNAPVTITSQSYQTTLAYNSWLGVTQTKGANEELTSMTYDSYGRPTSGTSPYCGSGCYGPTVSYSYGTSTPFTQTKTGPDGVTTTTLDGLGRAILVARGDTSGVHSYTATTYAPCACSPLAKIQKTSQPYAYGSSASAWTTYTYDGLGRPLDGPAAGRREHDDILLFGERDHGDRSGGEVEAVHY